TYQSNNFGVGLPIAEKNQSNWVYMEPLLANTALQADYAAITKMNEMFREMLAIRQSSKLFRLETAAEVQARQVYYNTGPSQLPGLIVMTLSDKVGTDLDPLHEQLVVLINASDEAQTFSAAELAGFELSMHPVLVNSVDEVVKTATYDPATGTFMVPGRTSVVFVEYASPAELLNGLNVEIDHLVATDVLSYQRAKLLKLQV
ncbi:MAG: DUF3372 domain-containing protein, partial [Anaerolineales bacterium]|nr:DUF3372 domain-containing protein [Anaerolineales bacterium]